MKKALSATAQKLNVSLGLTGEASGNVGDFINNQNSIRKQNGKGEMDYVK